MSLLLSVSLLLSATEDKELLSPQRVVFATWKRKSNLLQRTTMWTDGNA